MGTLFAALNRDTHEVPGMLWPYWDQASQLDADQAAQQLQDHRRAYGYSIEASVN